MARKKKDFCAVDYLEKKKKEIIDAILLICKDGSNKDAVRLKALSALLNKMMADKTKTEIEFTKSPYEVFMKSQE